MVDQSQRRKTAVTAIGGYVLNPKKHNLSFGRWAIPVMAKKMQSSEINERRRAVQSLCDFAFDSRRVASKEFASVVPILKDLCEDPDSKLRFNVAKCLGAVTATPAGRRAFDDHGFYDETLNLLKDEDDEVRHAANIVLQRLVISSIGAEGLVEAGAIPVLVERIPKEPDNTLEVLLQTLHTCCLIDPDSALDNKCLEAVIPLLKNSSASVRARAATVIKDLTEEAKGRNRALDLKAVPLLLDMCRNEDEVVQAKALGALMMYGLFPRSNNLRIATATPGKFMAIGENAIEKILPLVRKKNPEIRLNAIKVLTALSEAPPGRKQLIGKMPQLLSLLNDEVQEVRRAAKTLNAVVTFKP